MFQGSIEWDARRVQSMRAMGASQIGGGNSLAGNQCQRWLALFTAFGETQCRRQAWPYGGVGQLGVRGQAQGLPLQGTDGAEGT